jgi:hypothetical protein
MKSNHSSLQFRHCVSQRKYREYLYTEALSLIMLLYSPQIEAGTARIDLFRDMTGNDFTRELKLRTMIATSTLRARKYHRKTKAMSEENTLLEQLKNSL